MFRAGFERFKRIDPYLSLGNYLWQGAALFGIPVAAVMAWATSQLAWFWGTFQWAGVIGVGVITWLLIGVGLNLYRRSGPPVAPAQASSSTSGSQHLQLIEGKFFKNQQLHLDGKHYTGNTFEGVTIIYNGGPFRMDHNKIGGMVITTEKPEIESFVKLLNDFGYLKVPVFSDQGTMDPTNPFPESPK